MERREKCSPSFFFTPYALPVRIIVDLTISFPCWCVRLDRCCVELHYRNVWRCCHFFHWPLRGCAQGTGSKCLPQNTPIIEFDTTSTQSPARPQNNQTTALHPRRWRTCSWASNTFTRWSYSLWWQMVVLIHNAWFNFRIFLWTAHVLISGALAKHCPRWTSQEEQRWSRTRYLTCVFRALNDIACK